MMKGDTIQELVGALHEITNSSEQFVNRTPQLKRLATERQALLDAIITAQLLLSIHQRLHEEKVISPPSKAKLNRNNRYTFGASL